MDRRLIVLVGLAMAVVGNGVRLVPAQSPAAPAPRPMQPSPAVPLPPADAPPPPADMPPPKPAPSKAPTPRPAEPAPQAPSSPAQSEPAPAPNEALPPADALPAPSEMPAPAPAPPLSEAPRDPRVEKAQIPIQGARSAVSGASPKGAAPDQGPLPPASEPPGRAGAGAGAGAAGTSESAAREPKSFVLPPEKLPMGRQAVGLTVDVVAPQAINLNHPTTLKIVVRNTGTTDAMNVAVRDALPEGLTFLASVPEANQSEPFLFWELGTVSAGSERVISVKVKPVKVGPFEHAATVTMLAGSKSRTIVREPRLKVELIATPVKVLKGQQVQFKISISNPGSGPARNVVVQAKLSPGLRHESGEPNDQNMFEQTIDQIEAGQRVVLEALVVDTVAADEQSCEVVAKSSDVTTGLDEARSLAGIHVVEPKLKVAIVGNETRYTDTIASYTITVENTGSSTANNVRVLATLPLSGRLVEPPGGARWDPSSGKLLWTIPQVEPGEKEKVTLPFQVRMGGLGFYQVTVDARADTLPTEHASFKTDVLGLAELDFDINARQRVIDVGDTTAFQIRIKNIGTKDATHLLVRAVFSKNIDPLETNNSLDDRSEAQFNAAQQLLVFPQIDRLSPGKEVVLGIKVKAVDKGVGTCRVYLMHDDLEDQNQALENMATFRITPPRQPR